MNLYFRLLFMVIASFFKPRVDDALSESTLQFHVLPTDLDLNGHMNNGRYLTIMDLGRMDFVLRVGLAGYVMRNKYLPVLSAAQMRYRLPLLPFQKYTLTTRILCWDEKWFYMEQRFIINGGKKDGAVAAIGLLKGSFFSKAKRATAPVDEIVQAIGQPIDSPAFPAYITEWAKAEEALREITATDAV